MVEGYTIEESVPESLIYYLFIYQFLNLYSIIYILFRQWNE